MRSQRKSNAALGIAGTAAFGMIVTVLIACGDADLAKGDQRDIVPTSSPVEQAQFTTSRLDENPPPPQTAEVPALGAETAEGLYLSLLDSFGVEVGTTDVAVTTGWKMCRSFDNPHVSYGLLMEAATATQDVFTPQDVANIVYSAVMALCPEHLDRLP